MPSDSNQKVQVEEKRDGFQFSRWAAAGHGPEGVQNGPQPATPVLLAFTTALYATTQGQTLHPCLTTQSYSAAPKQDMASNTTTEAAKASGIWYIQPMPMHGAPISSLSLCPPHALLVVARRHAIWIGRTRRRGPGLEALSCSPHHYPPPPPRPSHTHSRDPHTRHTAQQTMRHGTLSSVAAAALLLAVATPSVQASQFQQQPGNVHVRALLR